MKSKFFRLFLFVSIVLVLFARFHVAMVRYFDPDEFAHLHWAWLMSSGFLPYRDFFFYITPLYQWFLWPLFTLPPSETILLLARLWQFGLYLLVLFLLYRITFNVTRLVTVSLLTILVFTTFPLTFDKTIDIRPDFLMLLPYLVAIDRLLTWKTITKAGSLLVGILLGTSIVVFQKTIPMVPVALLLFFLNFHSQKSANNSKGVNHISDRISYLHLSFWVMVGVFIPAGMFFLYLLVNNLRGLAWEAFTHTQFVVNEGKETFSLLATLSPWPLVYVSKGGVSLPWMVNMGVWLAALCGLLIIWRQHRYFALFATFFSLSAFLFLFLFPAPYVQYFIPLSFVASILASIGIFKIFSSYSFFLFPFSFFLLSFFLLSFFLQYRERVLPSANNAEQLQVIRDVLAISKPSDTFYDGVGSYVFRPDGYFICCHPYAEFVDKLRQPIPPLSQSLISNHTQFLILDRTGQSLWKPKKEDLDYLKSNFKPSQYPKIYIRN